MLALSCAILMHPLNVEAANCCGNAGTHDITVSGSCTVKRACNACGEILSRYELHSYEHKRTDTYDYGLPIQIVIRKIYVCSKCGDIMEKHIPI